MTNCELCSNYVYDDESECFVCMINLDADEMFRFLSGTNDNCSYFSLDDEYGIVKKQM